jgi:hypothetical protein
MLANLLQGVRFLFFTEGSADLSCVAAMTNVDARSTQPALRPNRTHAKVDPP